MKSSGARNIWGFKDMEETELRVAAIQMISSETVEENLKTAGEMIAAAVRQKARLVLLPEDFALLGIDDRPKLAIQEPEGQGPVQAFLAATAARHGIWLVGGSIPLQTDCSGKISNSCLVFNPAGKRIARYDKIHLFSLQKEKEWYREEDTVVPGIVPVAFATPWGRIGLSICYDLRFPELYRALGKTILLLVPAAFTEATGRAHWEILLRARAIENQSYVLAAGQGGSHANGRQTHGNSMLIDPWGTIIDRTDKGNGIVQGCVEVQTLDRIREKLPALTHRIL